jgi:hypothetical protein
MMEIIAKTMRMKNDTMFLALIALAAFFGILTLRGIHRATQPLVSNISTTVQRSQQKQGASSAQSGAKPAPRLPYIYTFNQDGTLNERASMEQSGSSYWWVNSGGGFTVQGGIGSTLQGSLPSYNRWRLLYLFSNPQDTDSGYRPQNIFRLVSRTKWKNMTQEFRFRIVRDNLSDSPNRNESNGVLMFDRYQDGNNLYYAGIRVDGTAVIKKKLNGHYYTLAQEPIFGGAYDKAANPNLLPKNTWMGIRSTIKDTTQGVLIALYLDFGDGTWMKAAQALDDGRSYGRTIASEGYAGIRTDFMDVEFKDYKIVEEGK